MCRLALRGCGLACLPGLLSCRRSPPATTVQCGHVSRGGGVGGGGNGPAVLRSPGLDLIPDSSPGEVCVSHPSPDWDRNGL